ncbi:hypothetical protein AALP_AA1G027300 [Arabis alpina]|uniref:Uncharacterized protein n=1 Tax=Arabis alpina TaxID=50452 RepID=A0A087HKN9_ARAAL|nr:hypothetical protein AALP_AA1G027300 [Arabis alpina]
MASHSYSTLGFSILQELGSNEIIKSRAYLVNHGGRRHEIKTPTSFGLKLEHLEPWKPFCSWSKSNHFVEFEPERPEKARVKPSPKQQNPKIRDRDKIMWRPLRAFDSVVNRLCWNRHRGVLLCSL